MPDSPTVVPPAPALPPQNPVWGAIRAHLMGAEPDTARILQIRSLVTHLYATTEERMRALHALFAASPAAFRCAATECGWTPAMEACGVNWDLAVIAAVFADANPEEAK